MTDEPKDTGSRDKGSGDKGSGDKGSGDRGPQGKRPDGAGTEDKGERKSAALRLAEEVQKRPFTAAAIVSGAAAATAGAVMGARALARRNGEGKLNSVLKNAITAQEAAAVAKQQDEEGGGSGGGAP